MSEAPPRAPTHSESRSRAGRSTTVEPRPNLQHCILQIGALIRVKHAVIALGYENAGNVGALARSE
jgi:hypothetical protein